MEGHIKVDRSQGLKYVMIFVGSLPENGTYKSRFKLTRGTFYDLLEWVTANITCVGFGEAGEVFIARHNLAVAPELLETLENAESTLSSHFHFSKKDMITSIDWDLPKIGSEQICRMDVTVETDRNGAQCSISVNTGILKVEKKQNVLKIETETK